MCARSWNMMMGHVLGLSTSGIPMSAKIVSVVPHPAKAALHGGRFGPEQRCVGSPPQSRRPSRGRQLPITLSPVCVLCGPRSPLAPLAYALGVAMLLAFYGTRGMDEWEQKLQGDGLLQAAVQPVLPAAQT